MEDTENEKPSELVPDMKEPLIFYGSLPGDWNFLHIKRPGKNKEIDTNTTIQQIVRPSKNFFFIVGIE